MKRVYACLVFTVLALFFAAVSSHATMTYLRIQGVDSNFTMVQGDTMTWEADCASGATVQCEIWLDVNENDTIEPGIDYQWMNQVIPWQDGGNAGGPPDMDTTVNGHLYFAMVLGFPPGKWILRFTDPSDNSTKINAGTVNAIAAPFRRITGTVSGPGGFDPGYIIVSTDDMWMALTDSIGHYQMDFDSSFSAGDTLELDVDDRSGYVTPPKQYVVLGAPFSIDNINFVYSAPAAYVYGRILDDQGQPVTGNVGASYQPAGGGDGDGVDLDSTGFYQIGFSAADLGQWRISAWRQGEWAPDYMQPRDTTVTVNDSDSIRINITVLRADSTITGRIIENGGAPSRSYELQVTGDYSTSAYSDSVTGDYTLHVSSTLGQLWVYINTDSQYGTPLPPGYTIEGDWQKEAYPGDAGIDFNLVQGGSISGTVRAQGAGTPIAGIQVELRGWDWHNYGQAQTDSAGNFTIAGLMAGNYRLQAQGGYGFVGEWYNDKQNDWQADSIRISTGQNLGGFNFYLSSGAMVMGRVTDQSMNPLNNMWVEVRDWSWSVNYGGNTDTNGDYSISVPAGVYRAQANSNNGYLGEWYNHTQASDQAETLRLTQGDTARNINFQLGPAAYILGTVRDPGNNPLNNVNIMCQNMSTRNWSGNNTDGSGHYFMSVEPGRYVVVVQNPPPGYARQAYNQRAYTSSVWDTIMMAAGDTARPIDFKLSAGSTISGHIYNNSSMPLNNYNIEVRDTNNSGVTQTSTNDSGAYTLTVEPGTYFLQAHSNNGYIGEYYNNTRQWSQAETIVVEESQNLGGYNFYLDRYAQISGFVRDEGDNHALGNAEVQAEQLGGGWNSNWTDSTGYYSLQVEPGRYFVRVQNAPMGYFTEEYNNQSIGSRRDTITVVSDEMRNIDFYLSNGFTLSGTVRSDADSHAAVNVDVRIDQWTGMWWNQAASTSTDTSGAYTLTGLSSGTYRLYFSGAGFITEYYNNKPDQSQADQFNLNADTAGFNAYLAPGGIITGRVMAESDSHGLANASIQLSDFNWNGFGGTNTDSNGYYTFSGLPTGNFRVQMQSAGGYAAEWYNNKTDGWNADTVRVTAGSTTNGINFYLTARGVVAGQVTAEENGAPLRNAQVQVAPVMGGMGSSVNTDSTGYYSIEVDPGQYFVRIEYPPFDRVGEEYNHRPLWSNQDTVTVTSGNTTTINLALTRGAHISGTVRRDQDAAPVESVNVQLVQVGWWDVISEASTDAAGNYTLFGVPGGSYRLYFAGQARGYVDEYYNNKFDGGLADTITVAANTDYPGYDASLGQGGAISGFVKSTRDSQAVAGATVRVYNMNWNQIGQGTTDSSGNYTVGGLSSGGYRLEFWTMGGFVSEYYNDRQNSGQADSVSVIAGSPTTGINCYLAPYSCISGYVRSEIDSTTFSNVQLSVRSTQGSSWWPSTDMNGYYNVMVPAGAYFVNTENNLPPGFIRETYNDRPYNSTLDTVFITAGDTLRNINFYLAQGGSISGRVYAQKDTQPVNNIEVRANDGNNSFIASDWTDVSGAYTILGLPAGTVKLEIWNNGRFMGEWYRDRADFNSADSIVLAEGQDTTGFNFYLAQYGYITGVVQEEGDSTPITSGNVAIYSWNNTYITSAGLTPNGRYTTGGLPAGRYFVQISWVNGDYICEAYNNQPLGNFVDTLTVVEAETTRNIDFYLDQPANLAGGVFSAADSTVVPSTQIELLDAGFTQVNHTWGDWSTGTFSFSNVAPGTYYLLARGAARGYLDLYYEDGLDTASAIAITVQSGDTVRDLNFFLPERSAIAGRITSDSSGNTAGLNVLVSLYAAADSVTIIQNTWSSGEGYYTFNNLQPGDYVVFVDDQSGRFIDEYYQDGADWQSATVISVDPAESVRADIGLAHRVGSIAGTVQYGATGLEGLAVSVYTYDNPQLVGSTVTNSSGGYLLTGLPALANYRIYVNGRPFNYTSEWYDNQRYQNSASAVWVYAESTVTADVVLDSGTIISGTVTREIDALPLQNVVMLAVDANSGNVDDSVLTDVNGGFSFHGLMSGQYKIRADASGAGYAVEWWDNQTTYTNANTVNVGAGEVWSVDTMSLGAGGYISGYVRRDEDNAAIPDMRMTLYSESWNEVARVNSNSSGYYRFAGVPPGTYYLQSDGSNNYIPESWNNRTDGGNDPVVLATVVDTTGFDFYLEQRGVARGWIVRDVDGANQNAWMGLRLYLIDESDTVSTSAWGTFQINIPAGRVVAEVYSPLYSTVFSDTLTLGQGDTVDMQFRMRPRLVINEVHYNGGVLEGSQFTNPEYVELSVVEEASAGNCYLRTTLNSWQLPGSCPVLPAGSFVVVHMGHGTDTTIGDVHHYYLDQSDAMNSTSGFVGLADNWNNLMDMVAYGGYNGSYGDWCGWPNSGSWCTDGGANSVNQRYSVSLLPDGDDRNNGSNWGLSDRTPGEANTAATRIVEDVTGTGTYTFGGIGLTLNIIGLTGADSISVTVNSDSFPANMPAGYPVKRWFTIHAGSGIDSIRTVVTFSYTQAEFDSSDITDEATLYAARWNGGEWEIYPSLVNTLNNTVSCTTLAFSDWALGGEGGPVPVTLTALTAQVAAGAVQIDWATVSEQGNLGWNVYRRSGATGVFEKVNAQLVPGGNTTAQPRFYQYTDPIIVTMSGTVSYYLEQVDLNGATYQSPVVSVSIPATGMDDPLANVTGLGLTATPNPFTAAVAMRVMLQQPGHVELTVYDARGHLVRQLVQGRLTAGSHRFVWDGRGQAGQRLDNGVYTVRLMVNGVTGSYGLLLAR
jgi:hypothetical protein